MDVLLKMQPISLIMYLYMTRTYRLLANKTYAGIYADNEEDALRRTQDQETAWREEGDRAAVERGAVQRGGCDPPQRWHVWWKSALQKAVRVWGTPSTRGWRRNWDHSDGPDDAEDRRWRDQNSVYMKSGLRVLA